MKLISTAAPVYGTGMRASTVAPLATASARPADVETWRERAVVHAEIALRVTGELCPQAGATGVVRDQFPTSLPGTTVFGAPPV